MLHRVEAEIPARIGRAVEYHQHVGVAVVPRMISYPGAEERKPHNAEASLQFRFALAQQGDGGSERDP